MLTRCRNGRLVLMLMFAIVLVGCAKRPATTQASAPAPTGAAGATAARDMAGTSSGGPGAVAGRPGGTAMGTETTPPGMQPGAQAGTQPGSGTPGMAASQPGTAMSTTTAPGATGAARPAPQEFTAVPELKDIHFDFDRYDIRPGDAVVLDANAAWLKQHPNMLVLIEGHCDERGTNEYNLALGERRAKAAMNYLVAQGVQSDRITIISYGEERPACFEKGESCWAKNRRAHFLVKPR